MVMAHAPGRMGYGTETVSIVYRLTSSRQQEQFRSQLQLSLLGTPVVKHGERTLTFSTRKALALLAYLAVEGGMHPRKTLSESFWPELDAEHGRAALRATLFELRKPLERSHGPGERTHLLVERDTLGFDPLNEEGYRRLMRLRFSRGDRIGALRAYANCRAVLADQLQVEPEPETVALAKRIRHTAPVRAPQVRSLRPSQTSPGLPPANLLDGPFLGRTAEFGTLIECYQRMRTGLPQLVLLQGETGIGKTRLATEFAHWSQAQGAAVLVGGVLQTGRRLPYQPLIDVLRRQMEQEGATDDLLSDAWLAELSRLLPELRDRYPDLPVPSTDEALGHNRLFEATARLVQVWAGRHPLVLLLDDMQWAATATLDLLLYLARSLAEQPAPVLLLLNLCTGAESCTGSQSSWLMALKRTRIPLTALELAAFSKEETQRFVQGFAWVEQPLQVENTSSTERGPQHGESPLSRDALVPFANWLYVQTQGQPFYLV